MRQPLQKTMRAIALDRFGGPGVLTLHTLPLPEIGPDDVLIRVQIAGVGVWDSFEREGGYAEMLGLTSRFPYVPGSEGAGTVAATGAQVSRFREGDPVYAVGFLNPRGGFYAEYVAVNADYVSFIPGSLTIEQAGGMAGVGLTALRGLDDILGLRPGESLLIFGASGGIGHMAVQIAKHMGARVLAVASGNDGVEMVRRLGADAAVDGRRDDLLEAARKFAPEGLDTALLTAGGEMADKSLMSVRDGGRVAYPGGINPETQARPGIQLISYNGEPDRDITERLNRLIESGSFKVEIARIFPLDQAAEAHRALETHYLGKLVLQVS
jgi:NADPH:quinone reductase-like Zn-dependent oxidoreductase